MTKRYITLCADDFGLNKSINDAIIKLAKLDCISGVSVLTQTNEWKVDSSRLLELSADLDLGVHLNLTEIIGSVPYYALNKLILLSNLRLISKEKIKNTFRNQINLFIQYSKTLPNFLDGHQHIHGFPVIRDALLEVIQEFWGQDRDFYVRNPSKFSLFSKGYFLKKIVLKTCYVGLDDKLNSSKIFYPSNFSGFYDFNSDYPSLFSNWLSKCSNGELFMCHPAIDLTAEFLGNARYLEYKYFSSDQFLADCKKNNVILSRVSII